MLSDTVGSVAPPAQSAEKTIASEVYMLTTDSDPMLTVNMSTNDTAFGRNEELAKLEIAVQGLILFLAILGNGIVLLVLFFKRKNLSRMNLMIIHLSCADLFVAFFNVLPQMAWDITYRFVGGDFMCRTVKYLQVAAMYASSYVLIMTAVDRYLAVCHPLVVHTWTRNRMHLLVLLAWILSLLFSIPQLFIFSYREIDPGSGVYDCWGQFNPDWTLQLYITWFAVAIYVIPFIILTVAYGKICFVVWSSMRSREMSVLKKSSLKSSSSTASSVLPSPASSSRTNHARVGTTWSQLSKSDISRCSNSRNSYRPSVSWAPLMGSDKVTCRSTASFSGNKANPRAHTKGVSKSKVKTVKLTLAVIACYLLCWGPFFVTLMWSAWDPNAPFTGEKPLLLYTCARKHSITC